MADGHENAVSRIVKFDKTGKYLMEWGKKGTGPGEFDTPHAIAIDSQGRLFVGDRANSRVQVFDQTGKLLEVWRQFGRASGLFIDANDVMYSADSESNTPRNPGFQRGIRIGSVKDGRIQLVHSLHEQGTDGCRRHARGGRCHRRCRRECVWRVRRGGNALKYVKK